jgi:hypothetical protein
MNTQTQLLLVTCFALCSIQPAVAQTKAVIADDPIVLPKQDAARVTARVNDKAGAAPAYERVEESNVRGQRSVRVTPEHGYTYSMSDQQPTAKRQGSDNDKLRVPLWQVLKF